MTETGMEAKPKRTILEINKEYAPLVGQMGERQYHIMRLTAEMNTLSKRVDDLAKEAAEVEAANKAATVTPPAATGV